MKKILLFLVAMVLTGNLFGQTRSVELVPENFSAVYSAPVTMESDGLKFTTVGYRNGNLFSLKDLVNMVGQELRFKWYLKNSGAFVRGNIGLAQTDVSMNDIQGFRSQLNQWLYTTIIVNADYTYSVVTRSGSYAGTVVDSKSGTITDVTQRAVLEKTNVKFYFWDTYDENAFLTLGELIVPSHSGLQYSEFTNYGFEGGTLPPEITVGGSASVVPGGSKSDYAFYMQGSSSTSDFVEFSTEGAEMVTFDVKLNHNNSYRIMTRMDEVDMHALSVYSRGATSYSEGWCEVALPVSTGTTLRVEFLDSDGQDLYLDNIRFYKEQAVQPPSLSVDDIVLNENSSIGTLLGTATVIDATGVNYQLEVSDITAGGNGLFAFSGDNLEVQNVADYETHGPGFSDVLAYLDTEDFLPLVSTTFAVTINDVDEAPVVAPDQEINFDEKSDEGTSLGFIAATDEDLNDSYTFSVVSGDDAGFFNLNESSGELTLTEGFIAYNDYTQFSLVVRATEVDDQLLFGEATVVLNVNDILFSGGTGTELDPFRIKTAEDLDDIRNYLGSSHTDKYFELMNDIDLLDFLSAGNPGNNEGALWAPIGNDFNSSFRGNLNGNNFSISNLAINRPDEYYVGFFGQMYQASVSHLTIEIPGGATVEGTQYIGALSGSAEDVNINGVNVSGTIYGNLSDVGGLIGYLASGVLENCHADVNVSTTGNYAGGVVGRNWGSVIKCFTEGIVSAENYAGGLVGMNDNNIFMGYLGSLDESYSNAVVNATSGIGGGLAGYNVGVVSNSYATGSINGSENIGGLVGSNAQAERSGFMEPETVTGAIINCYSAAVVSGSGATIGGFAGVNDGDITSSYWDINASGQQNSAGGTSLDRSEMRDANSFADWDFSTVWGIEATESYRSYPYLLSNEENPHPGRIGVVTVNSWPGASDIVYGQTVDESALINGVASHEGNPVAGAFQFLNGGMVHTPGTYTEILAFIPENETDYFPVPDGSTSLVVGPKSVSVINAVPANKIYDGNTAAVISGAELDPNDVEGVDEVILSNHTTGVFFQAEAANEIAVTVSMELSGADAMNYVIGQQPVLSASIEKAPLLVMANDNTRLYGEANPALSISYDGFVNGEDAAVLALEPQPSTTANENSVVGDYTITVENGTDENYNFSYQSGMLSINQAPLTVKAKDVTRAVGEANPVFELEYVGFVNGEDATVVDSTPVAECAADEQSVPGDYDISVSGGTDNNYYFVYDATPGLLTVTTATSILSGQESAISVYPVPAHTYVFIKGILNADLSSVTVVDLTGKLIKVPYAEVSKQEMRLDVTSLKSGIYFVKIQKTNDVVLEKIVVL